MVEADSAVPSRSEVLALLDTFLAAKARGDSEEAGWLTRLMTLSGGEPYRYMYSRMFPALRRSTLLVEYAYGRPALPPVDFGVRPLTLPVGIVALPALPLIAPEAPAVEASEGRNLYMAVRSNLLYDLLAVPDLGVEFYVGRGWSVAAEGPHAWWSRNSRHRYWRIYGGGLTVRRWFGRAAERKPLTGHHLGLYAGAITFDFEMGGTGIMGGLPRGTIFDRALFFGGIEYGYSLPIASRLNLDFTIGLGYLGGKYIKYRPSDWGYMEESEHRLGFLGPTKAEVALVWLIGRGNRNVKKGGRL